MLRDDVGVDYQFGPWTGRRRRLAHADRARRRTAAGEDRRYRALRRVLRNRLAIRAFRWLHPDLATPLATDSSHASRTTPRATAAAGCATRPTRARAGGSVARS